MSIKKFTYFLRSIGIGRVRCVCYITDIWSSMIDDLLAPTDGILLSVLGVLMSGVNVVGCSLCGRERWKYHHFCPPWRSKMGCAG